MQNTELVDKSRWQRGPWDDEPDRLEWKTAAGLPGLMVRHPRLGHWCGYVAVPPGHPCHGRSEGTDYEKDANGDEDYLKPLPNPVNELNAHGGITYAAACDGHVCHVPEPGEPDDVWWLGFDCAHSGDHSPYGTPFAHDTYRDVAYVRGEVEDLAAQLVNFGQEMGGSPKRGVE